MLYLKDYVHNPELSSLEFLFMFLMVYNKEYDTYNEWGLDTKKEKSRSLGDISSVVINYYPDETIDSVKEMLLSFGENLVGHYCDDIDKRVYQLKYYHTGWGQMEGADEDEYGNEIEYRDTDVNAEVLLNSNLIPKDLKIKIKEQCLEK